MRAHVDHALHYAELGYGVFPCRPGTKKPLTKHGFKDAVTDAEVIRRWWKRWPHANIGIATEGLIVVDIDSESWLADEPEKRLDLEKAPVSVTPRGGTHHLFRQPPDKKWRNTSSTLAPGIDTRADGGYIVAPPSVRSGGEYVWASGGLYLRPCELPEPPEWLISILDELAKPPQPPPVRTPRIATTGDVEKRAIAYLDAMPPAISGAGGHNATYAAATALVHGFGIEPDRALEILLAHYNPRCEPPWSEKELCHKVDDAASKPHDLPFGWLRDQAPPSTDSDVDISGILAKATQTAVAEAEPAISRPKSLRQLVENYPALREPVITGLLREGETMNVISAPKIGKSWLVIDLALAVATGRPWFDMETVQGDVLILDNELHGETSANRIPKVAAARGVEIESVADHVYVENLRGRLQDLFSLGPYFRQFEPGRFKVVILDAFYRFLPMRADENDNGTMAGLYNYLDSFADYLKCSFVLIHHTSKGNQSLKAITDVGAGAGAQSRATDTHLVLRRHEEEDAVVLDAAVRSWPPVLPRCLRWAFPVWMPADDLDPAALKDSGRKGTRAADREAPPSWNARSFVDAFLTDEPKSQARLLEEAETQNVSSRRVKRLLDLAEEDGLAFRWSVGPRKTLAYATIAQPEDAKRDDSKRALVQSMLVEDMNLSTHDVAEKCGVSDRYVRRIRKDLEG